MVDDPAFWQHVRWVLGRPETWWLLTKILALLILFVWGLAALIRRKNWLGLGLSLLAAAGAVWLVSAAFRIQAQSNIDRMTGVAEAGPPNLWPALVLLCAHALGTLAVIGVAALVVRAVVRQRPQPG